MDISITGVSKQRQFLKTCVRLRWFLDGLRGCCDELSTDSKPFDALQLVFMDRPESFLKPEGTRSGDRLYQVLVGIGVDRHFSPQGDRQFLCFLAHQVLRAVQQSPLGAEVREGVSARVERWRDSLGDRFDETNGTSA
jgi:hypothetical protein